jgi:adenylate kinase
VYRLIERCYSLLMDKKIQTIQNWLGSGSINIFGRPFAGKDTQGEKLAEFFGGELMAGGDILRSYHDQSKIKELMSTGELFPSDFYLNIILPYLSKVEIRDKPLILSSIGRLKGEETTILQAAKESGHDIKAVIALNLSEDEVMNRFRESRNLGDRGQREDDNHDVLKNRLTRYREQTISVIGFYKENGLLIEVDGSQPRKQVTEEIINKLYEKASK